MASRQAHLCVQTGRARAFRRSVAQFAAIDPRADPEAGDLSNLVKGRPEGLVLMQAGPVSIGPGLRCIETLAGVQMVASNRVETADQPGVTALSCADIPAMLALVALTKPGPFKRNTIETGQYWGMKVGGHLIAMAGERMKLTGFTEISAICTHPGHRGRGFAGLLTSHVAHEIRARGETPFLHTYASNRRAIALYESLGFELCQDMQIARVVADP